MLGIRIVFVGKVIESADCREGRVHESSALGEYPLGEVNVGVGSVCPSQDVCAELIVECADAGGADLDCICHKDHHVREE